MYNTELKTSFLESCNPADASRFSAVFSRAAKFENEFQTDLNSFSLGQFEKFFSTYAGKDGIKHQFQVISLIKAYMEWCRDEGVITALDFERHPVMQKTVQEIVEIEPNPKDVRYFGSTDDFLDAMTKIFADKKAYRMTQACLVLFWIGLDISTIATIRRADIGPDTTIVAGKPIDDPRLLDILREAACSDGYLTENGRAYFYKESSYLIRSCLSKNGLPISTLDIVTNTANSTGKRSAALSAQLPIDSKYHGFQFSNRAVSLSGIFCRMYKMERQYGPEYLDRHCGETLSVGLKNTQQQKSNLFRKYALWKRLFGK